MGCALFTTERHNVRWPKETPVIITRCRIDDHICGCGGDLKNCDKELAACPHGVWQGPEVFCKHESVMEIRECKCDMDFCDLPVHEQAKIDYKFKKEAV